MPNVNLLALLMVFLVPVLSAQTGDSRSRRTTAPKSTSTAGAYKSLAGTFHGTLKDLSGKEIVILSDENQTVSIRRSRKTKFFKEDREVKPAEIPMNTPVSVDAVEDIDLKPTAISVTIDSPKKTSEK